MDARQTSGRIVPYLGIALGLARGNIEEAVALKSGLRETEMNLCRLLIVLLAASAATCNRGGPTSPSVITVPAPNPNPTPRVLVALMRGFSLNPFPTSGGVGADSLPCSWRRV